MTTLSGTYHNGNLTLDRPFRTKKPVRVTIMFDEEEKTSLTLSDFSFTETQELLKDCETSFSDEVIEERRNAL
ncbi:MAG: hypothetical protein K9H64_01800 [Bacteroidales bacterium]|nr:hypothetical protein [Bacteroidales bacterium]MCF8454721.1 hypothetical protein [Bacteroidales bacterium]